MSHEDIEANLGISRRDLIRRGAIVGGTLVWAAPVVQSIAPKALAQTGQGTPACEITVIFQPAPGGPCFQVGVCTAEPECCTCLLTGLGSPCDDECASQNCVSTPVTPVPCP
jgi:hypothetical protein